MHILDFFSLHQQGSKTNPSLWTAQCMKRNGSANKVFTPECVKHVQSLHTHRMNELAQDEAGEQGNNLPSGRAGGVHSEGEGRRQKALQMGLFQLNAFKQRRLFPAALCTLM